MSKVTRPLCRLPHRSTEKGGASQTHLVPHFHIFPCCHGQAGIIRTDLSRKETLLKQCCAFAIERTSLLN